MKKIENQLYRITFGTGIIEIVECVNDEELKEYVSKLSKTRLITNVTHINIYSDAVRTPRVKMK